MKHTDIQRRVLMKKIFKQFVKMIEKNQIIDNTRFTMKGNISIDFIFAL
ncbi:hypothetical protein [Virgibacillus oceani]|nr:hypothetical protein [Virgibacillus oceani]